DWRERMLAAPLTANVAAEWASLEDGEALPVDVSYAQHLVGEPRVAPVVDPLEGEPSIDAAPIAPANAAAVPLTRPFTGAEPAMTPPAPNVGAMPPRVAPPSVAPTAKQVVPPPRSERPRAPTTPANLGSASQADPHRASSRPASPPVPTSAPLSPL